MDPWVGDFPGVVFEEYAQARALESAGVALPKLGSGARRRGSKWLGSISARGFPGGVLVGCQVFPGKTKTGSFPKNLTI